MIRKGLSFKGYAESLPTVGSTADRDPPNCQSGQCIYSRKHVPWITFANIPNGPTVESSSNLRFADFPSDYAMLPTVASNLRSVLKPVVDVLDHFILKFDQTVFTAPPLIDFVLRRLEGLHHDVYPHWA